MGPNLCSTRILPCVPNNIRNVLLSLTLLSIHITIFTHLFGKSGKTGVRSSIILKMVPNNLRNAPCTQNCLLRYSLVPKCKKKNLKGRSKPCFVQTGAAPEFCKVCRTIQGQCFFFAILPKFTIFEKCKQKNLSLLCANWGISSRRILQGGLPHTTGSTCTTAVHSSCSIYDLQFKILKI